MYDAGRFRYLDLLDAQRKLTAVERNEAQLKGSRAVTTVALIRALGGGWDSNVAVGSPDKDISIKVRQINLR
ncbi:hypothetical protein QN379_10930 [Glaciimonas sp. Gout2]|uniref:hypothetical protein n=1 Tax=unclassified Glaciimonas TaxID=2644401 RepID=UPI002B225AE8|nr:MULTISPECIES: hypothetical protein [unclassified Glaciimonas]MEB0013232.1 hypothetical protein [Glaciimonas sp. Cout2]MEB0082527.1 hypothetical protein [Glaciimonas sp. Gout2]